MNETLPLSFTNYKINSKLIKNLNVRPREENRKNALGHWNMQGFFGQDCKKHRK
jgi:hypothetical protein